MEERASFFCGCSEEAKDGTMYHTKTAEGIMVPVLFLCDDCKNAPAPPVDPDAEYEPF